MGRLRGTVAVWRACCSRCSALARPDGPAPRVLVACQMLAVLVGPRDLSHVVRSADRRLSAKRRTGASTCSAVARLPGDRGEHRHAQRERDVVLQSALNAASSGRREFYTHFENNEVGKTANLTGHVDAAPLSAGQQPRVPGHEYVPPDGDPGRRAPPVSVANAVADMDATPSPTRVPLATATPTPRGCVVPSLAGFTLAKAKRALTAVHCTLGSVRRVRARRAAIGLVVRSSPTAGRRPARGTRVSLTIGRR
jgi:hypothetical protein